MYVVIKWDSILQILTIYYKYVFIIIMFNNYELLVWWSVLNLHILNTILL